MSLHLNGEIDEALRVMATYVQSMPVCYLISHQEMSAQYDIQPTAHTPVEVNEIHCYQVTLLLEKHDYAVRSSHLPYRMFYHVGILGGAEIHR